MVKPPKQKTNIVMRILVLVAGLSMVVIAVALVAFRDRLNLDTLQRWFAYRSLELNDSGEAQPFHCGGSASDVYVTLDDDLLVCTKNSIGLWSQSGTQYVDQAAAMAAPAAYARAGTAVVYDAGGTQLFAFRQRALAFSLNSDGPLVSARINANGLLVVVSQQSGYRSVVTVYNADFQPVAAVNLSSVYAMDAQLADDGHTLIMVIIGQNGGSFSSSLAVCDLNTQAYEVSFDIDSAVVQELGSSVILELEHDGHIWALGDRQLAVLDGAANPLGTANWSDRYLRAFSLQGDGFAVALLGKYRAGTQTELSVMDTAAALVGSLALDEQVLSVSAAGRYFAVLTSDRLDIYTKDMSLYSSLEGVLGARKVLLRPDGTAFLISSGTAWLYVPI